MKFMWFNKSKYQTEPFLCSVLNTHAQSKLNLCKLTSVLISQENVDVVKVNLRTSWIWI